MTDTTPFTRAFEAKIDDVSTPRRTVTAKINTNCVDRYNTVIVPRGGDWSNFMRSGPAVLWEHGNDPNRGRLPVAHCNSLKYRKMDDDILGVMQFKGDDFSSQVMEMYADGTLRSFSVEFLPDVAKSGRPTQEEVRANPSWGVAHTIYRSWELTGFSAVSYPGNPEALALAVERGFWVPEETRKAIEEQRAFDTLPEPKPKQHDNDDDGDGDPDDSEDYDRSKIKKIGSEWGVYSDEGELIAKHKTKSDAVQQLKAIYVHKAKEGKKSAPYYDPKLGELLTRMLDRQDRLEEQLRAMGEGNGSHGGYTTKTKDNGDHGGQAKNASDEDKDEDDDEYDRYITHEDGQYVVHAEDGKVLGKHKTKADAVAQLQAIEISKHKKSMSESREEDRDAPLPVVQTFTLQDMNQKIIESVFPMFRTLYFAAKEKNTQDLDDLSRGRV